MTKIQGIGEQEYQLWRNHPATLMFRQYLEDFREELKRVALARWEADNLNLSLEHEIRAKREILAEMADVPFESIVTFYEADNAAEATQDSNR